MEVACFLSVRCTCCASVLLCCDQNTLNNLNKENIYWTHIIKCVVKMWKACHPRKKIIALKPGSKEDMKPGTWCCRGFAFAVSRCVTVIAVIKS